MLQFSIDYFSRKGFLNTDKLGIFSQQLVARPSSVNYMVAPVTGNDAGIRRAEIKQGIREVILCKDQDGKIGLRLKSIDNVSIFLNLSK